MNKKKHHFLSPICPSKSWKVKTKREKETKENILLKVKQIAKKERKSKGKLVTESLSKKMAHHHDALHFSKPF